MNTTFEMPYKPRISCVFAENHAIIKMYINMHNSPKRRVMQNKKNALSRAEGSRIGFWDWRWPLLAPAPLKQT